jgi:DNA-binding beta-propeller fold protein YncE
MRKKCVKRALLILAAAAMLAPSSQAMLASGGRPIALVTAETMNELLAVSLPGGRILKRLPMPADPENVETSDRTAVVVSTRGAAVTLVDVRRLRVVKVLRGFGSPHIPLIGADGRFAYVTDDARGQLVVIDLVRRRVSRRVYVGYGAHHMTEDSAGNQLWIALGERARSIAVVDVSNPGHPRLIDHVESRGAHDLAFSPGDARVWVTYDDRRKVGVFSASTGKLVRLLPAGSAPQHVFFGPAGGGGHAYVTSGDDGTLRIFSARTGQLLRTVRTSYGSFNLAPYASFVATSSLYRGTLMEFDENGRRRLTRHVAPAARDLAVATLP